MAGKDQEIIGIMDFKNKKIVLMGLGSYENGSGISAALFFAKEGAKLLITDLKTKKDLENQIKRLSAQGRSASGGKKFENIKYILGKHRTQDFSAKGGSASGGKSADYIFKNPSVPKDSRYLAIARKNKIPIINDWSIFFDRRPDNLLIGVTGSKGKSTTATLIYQILKTAKKDAVLCGNIGQSPLSMLNKIKKDTIVIAELSSWLLHEFEFVKKNPHIAIITNLMPDHLDKYKNIKEYFKDKENIFRFQKPGNCLILNRNDKNLRKLTKRAKSRVIWYDSNPKNAAVIVAKLLKIPKKSVNKAIKNFKGLPARLELIAKKNDIKYYNDTTATMPDATIYALRQLDKPLDSARGKIILIAGGVDKKLDYKNLANEIPKFVKALISFKGTASEKILEGLKNRNLKFKVISGVSSMKQAVETARKFAEKEDIILLSPASASFNLFKNEFDRGGQFVNEVKRL